MPSEQIILAFLWVCLMLIYLLGDVLRIFSGEFVAGELDGKKVSKKAYLGIASFMVLPIIMVAVVLIAPQQFGRILSIILSALFFLFNLVGIPTYPSGYDKFLLGVSLVFNIMIIWYAWSWG